MKAPILDRRSIVLSAVLALAALAVACSGQTSPTAPSMPAAIGSTSTGVSAPNALAHMGTQTSPAGVTSAGHHGSDAADDHGGSTGADDHGSQSGTDDGPGHDAGDDRGGHRGEPGDDNGQGEVEPEVNGIISGAFAGSCAAHTRSFAVGATQVVTDLSTVFVDGGCTALKTGDLVQVNGIRQSPTMLVATRVERK